MKSLVKISISPCWSNENKITVRVDEKNDHFVLICRRVSQLNFELRNKHKRKKRFNSIQWKKKVPAKKIKPLFDRLSNAYVPVIPHFPIGLDGCMYELEMNIQGYNSKFSWWSSPPEGYQPLDRFLQDLLKLSEYQKQTHVI